MYQAEPNAIEFARNTVLVDQFCKIATLCGNTCPVVPLKGMSLLLSVYRDNYARSMADIDLLVAEENVPELVQKLGGIGYRFRKSHDNLALRLKLKQKFDMVHADKHFCDLDVHTALVNRKFSEYQAENFTAFALTRLQTKLFNGLHIACLNPLDEWLYLAQHYCFHFFTHNKWLHDLYLIQRTFTPPEVVQLLTNAKQFHFQRVLTAATLKLSQQYGHQTINIPQLTTRWRSLRFVLSYRQRNRFVHKIVIIYRRFLFIDNTRNRNKALIKLLLPSLNYLSDTYRCNKLLAAILLPIHCLLYIFSLIAFFCILQSHSNTDKSKKTLIF